MTQIPNNMIMKIQVCLYNINKINSTEKHLSLLFEWMNSVFYFKNI